MALAVRKVTSEEGSGHDWWHLWRVWRLAGRIARSEPRADRTVVELGALLHDLGDWKFHRGGLPAAAREAGRLLRRMGAPLPIIRRVGTLCQEVSYRGAGVPDRPTSLEARIVQDADRLDALGAIGIARTFAYGGARGRPIHVPGVRPVFHRSFRAYRSSRGPTINHFYEKLLWLKRRLHTRLARKLAGSRHEFLERFLRQFHAEWRGDA